MRKLAKGWNPDVPDIRDFTYKIGKPVPIPKEVDMRPGFQPCYDQGELGSCTASSAAALLQYTLKEQNLPVIMPSRLLIYYNTRRLENTTKVDAGAQIRNTIKAVAKSGYCPEELWPYEITKFAKRPLTHCYAAAKEHLALVYNRVVPEERDILMCLAAGNPIEFGFSVYDYFMSDEMEKTGILKMPSSKEKNHGGHAVVLAGFNRAGKWFWVRNSWGTGWGPFKGYFKMPFEYVLNSNLSDDFWQISAVS